MTDERTNRPVSAKELLTQYVHRLQNNQGRRDSFPSRFFGAIGYRPIESDMRAYLRFMRNGSLPLAAELASFESASPCRDTLSLGTSKRLLACVAANLYLKAEDGLFADLFKGLGETDREAVADCRKEFLKSLRLILFRAQELRDFATLPDGDMKRFNLGKQEDWSPGAPDGGSASELIKLSDLWHGKYSSEEAGRIAYNHFGREALLFALFGTARGSKIMPGFRRALDDMLNTAEKSEPGRAKNRKVLPVTALSLFEPVFLSTGSDLRHPPHKGSHRPLLPATAEVNRYQEHLRAFLEAAESDGAERIIIQGGKRTDFASYLRLHLAYQLLTFLVGRASPLERHEWPSKETRGAVVEALSRIFARTGDPVTGNALDVLSHSTSGVWSRRYAEHRSEIAAQVLARAGAPPHVGGEMLPYEDLRGLLKSLGRAPIGIDEGGASDRVAIMVELAVELRTELLRIRDPRGRDPGAASRVARLESARSALIARIALHPGLAVEHVLGKLRTGVGERRLARECNPTDSEQLLRFEREIKNLADIRLPRDRHPVHMLRDDVPIWCLADTAREVLKRARHPEYQDLFQRDVDQKKIEGFFKQCWRRNIDGKGGTWPQKKWEYLFYKLCHEEGADRYRELYRRVAARARELRESERHGPDLYDRLIASGLVDEFENRVQRLLDGSGEQEPEVSGS